MLGKPQPPPRPKRHLSRAMTAITTPRQYDLTVNFFPRMSFGTTRIRKNTHTSKYAWIFTDATLASNPYPNFLGALLYQLTAIFS